MKNEDLKITDIQNLRKLKNNAITIKDKHLKRKCKYKLWDVICLVILANLSNANTWGEIETFGETNKAFLKQFLKLTGDIPTEQTIKNIFSIIDTNELKKLANDFVNSIIDPDKNQREIISIDGSKKNESSNLDEIKPLNVLNAYSSKYGMCIAQEAISSKSNEIPSIPLLLKKLNLKGTICTWNATNTQKSNVQAVIDNKGDYVVPIKGDHKNFKKDIADYFDEDRCLIIQSGYEGAYSLEQEKRHNKIIKYEYFQTEKISWFEEYKEWSKLKSFIYVRKTMTNLVTNEVTIENRYYISSLLLNIREVSLAIREHWQVENKLHWHLDFTFRLDENKTLNKKALLNFETVAKFNLKLLNMAKPLYNKSLRQIRYTISLDAQNGLTNIFNYFILFYPEI